MQKKVCSECGEPAEVSVCQIVSTVGRAPRLQRCSRAMAFCTACFTARIDLLRGMGSHGVQQPLSEAFTALADACAVQSKRQRHTVPALTTDGGR
jgi:hypothetical protein